MAASDYSVLSESAFCSVAYLSSTLTAGATTATISGYVNADSDEVVAGQLVMIGAELLRLDSAVGSTITVGRGCGDTIPQQHSAGTSVWFFHESFGTDETERGVGEEIGVKLPISTTSQEMSLDLAPPHVIEFVGRQIKPYPPGAVTIDSSPFYTHVTLNNANPSIAITWAHRDRVTQSNIIVDHSAASIGPEVGTTYTIRVFSGASPAVPLRTVTGITDTNWSYTQIMASADFGLEVGGSDGDAEGFIELFAVRDGHESYQRYTMTITVNLDGIDPSGWGLSWGTAWG